MVCSFSLVEDAFKRNKLDYPLCFPDVTSYFGGWRPIWCVHMIYSIE